MIDFYNGDYTIIIDGNDYYYKDLPEDYQRVIAGFMFPYYIVCEDYSDKITDDDKISWFRYINFAGTPQDLEHMKNLI